MHMYKISCSFVSDLHTHAGLLHLWSKLSTVLLLCYAILCLTMTHHILESDRTEYTCPDVPPIGHACVIMLNHATIMHTHDPICLLTTL